MQKPEILHYWYQFMKEVKSGEWCGWNTQFSTYIGTFRVNEWNTEATDLTVQTLTSFLSQSPSSRQLSTWSNFKSNSNPSNRSWSSRIRSEFESSCIRDSSSCAEINYITGYTNCNEGFFAQFCQYKPFSAVLLRNLRNLPQRMKTICTTTWNTYGKNFMSHFLPYYLNNTPTITLSPVSSLNYKLQTFMYQWTRLSYSNTHTV